MINTFKKQIIRHLVNILGWRTNRKIVVIESDDWGSIRMPSKEVYQKCLNEGYPVDLNHYEKYDSLASADDLELLFDLLFNFTDCNGNHPVFTANCVVANPDFKKIKESNFQEYHYELITQTFQRYPSHFNNFKLWKVGFNNRIFYPQFHAREHLNVIRFMEALQIGDPDAQWGFNNEMPGSIPKGSMNGGNNYVEATWYDSEKDKIEILKFLMQGLELFKIIFGYNSESIIPPNYTWSNDFNEPVFNMGVKYFQGIRKMREPYSGESPKYHNYYLGQRNQLGQIYLIRNVMFEPSMLNSNNNIDETCLSDMAIAFRLKKPVIISSHRINYVGFIDYKNRDRSLLFLSNVLKKALQKWPDIEFMTSTQLAKTIIET